MAREMFMKVTTTTHLKITHFKSNPHPSDEDSELKMNPREMNSTDPSDICIDNVIVTSKRRYEDVFI